MTSGGPDLFVVCKQCGSEVSPYITECPYCGARLRKRAPKLDREGRVQEPRARRGRRGRRREDEGPKLGRLRPGEIPGIRPERRPLLTGALVLASLLVTLLWRTTLFGLFDVGIVGPLGGDWWRVFTAPFAYLNSGYAFAVLGAIAVFGWLLERRHGPAVVAVLFLLGGCGGALAAAPTESFPLVLGANGAALAMTVAWSVPDVLALRAGEEIEGDLLGAGVILLVLALLPAFVPEADWVAGGVGLLAGLGVGLPLARLRPA